MLLFDPNCRVELPDLLGSSIEQLIQSLTELVVESVIRPRLSSGGENRRAVSRNDLNALLNHAAACSSAEALSKKLRTCPITNSLVPFGEDRAPQQDEPCPSCNQLLITQADPTEEEGEEDLDVIHHLVEPDMRAVESLFQDHLKFLFFFERVAELFVHHRREHPQDVRNFLNHLLSGSTRLRVSWRFLTVIIKSILSTRAGSTTVDFLLATIRCNAPTKELNSNTQNFLRALLVRADEDVRSTREDDRQQPGARDWVQAIMTRDWTVDRIHRLSLIREALVSGNIDVAVNALTEWTRLRRNEHDPASTEAFLFFVLNFASAEGDETRLGTIFSQLGAVEDFIHHPIVGPYIKILSPLSLGFNLLPAGLRAQRFEERLNRNLSFDDIFQHYALLQV